MGFKRYSQENGTHTRHFEVGLQAESDGRYAILGDLVGARRRRGCGWEQLDCWISLFHHYPAAGWLCDLVELALVAGLGPWQSSGEYCDARFGGVGIGQCYHRGRDRCCCEF